MQEKGQQLVPLPSIMTESLPSDEVSKFIALSLLVHITFFMLYTVKMSFFPDETFVYEPAIRVDLVALPDKILAPGEIPEPAPPEANKDKTSETPKDAKDAKNKLPDLKTNEPVVALTKTKNNAESAIDKIKKDLAIEKIKNMMGDDKKDKKTPPVSQYKGNILSPGTELTGVNKMDHEDYHALLDRHVKKFWSLPEWVATKQYKTQVRIFLNENGLLVGAKVVKPSGNPAYDESVMESVQKSAPYPPPPPKFKDIVRVEGILLGFPE